MSAWKIAYGAYYPEHPDPTRKILDMPRGKMLCWVFPEYIHNGFEVFRIDEKHEAYRSCAEGPGHHTLSTRESMLVGNDQLIYLEVYAETAVPVFGKERLSILQQVNVCLTAHQHAEILREDYR